MKKKSAKKKTIAKSFFRKAGEVVGSIGHELTEGKDKVVEVSQTVIEGISAAITPAKKKAAVKRKAAKKAVKKTIKKAAKKATSKKAAVKK